MELTEALESARREIEAGRLVKARRWCRSILAASPEHPDGHYLMAQVTLGRGQLESALNHSRRSIAQAPEVAAHHHLCGEILLRLCRFEEAVEALRTALSYDPSLMAVHAKLGVALQESDDVSGAIESYRRGLEQEPESVDLYHNLGTALVQAERNDEAIDAYREAATLAPQRHDLQLKLGVQLVHCKRSQEALAHLDTAATLNPDDAETFEYLSNANLELGRSDASVEAARRFASLGGESIRSLVGLSGALLSQGNVSEASTVCRRIVEREPGNRSALADLAIATFQQGDEAAAGRLIDYERFMQIHQVAPPAGFSSRQEFNRALLEHWRRHLYVDLEMNHWSCHEGMISDELLVEPKGPAGLLESTLRGVAEEYLVLAGGGDTHPFAANLPADGQIRTWMTQLRPHGYLDSHIHPSAWLSGIYYLSVPPEIGKDESDPAGWIEFGRAPRIYGCEQQGEIRTIRPAEGMMMLFPSYFYHRTIPVEGTADRISLSFDFY